MVIAASETVLPVTQTAREIMDGERAFYAAETAVEEGLYLFEKQAAALPLTGSGTIGGTGASWTRNGTELKIVPLGHPNVSTPASPGQNVSKTNPLRVSLDPGQSFQLDLSVPGVTDYPQHVRIDFLSGGSHTNDLLVINGSTQSQDTVGGNTKVPSNGNIDDASNLRFLLRNPNSSGPANVYAIEPNAGELPMGIVITGIGTIGKVERRIAVERKAWLVFQINN